MISKKSHQIGPVKVPAFSKALDDLLDVAKAGHGTGSEFFNPGYDWLIEKMRVFQDFDSSSQKAVIKDAEQLEKESIELNNEGKAGKKVWPDVAVRLETGGLGFFSQMGVARRPDLTQYYADGFTPNRDAISFSEENQELFAEIIPYITKKMGESFSSGHTIIQTDRQIGDAPGRSFHARQLLFGVDFPQLPYMWRQLTFDLHDEELQSPPDILEVSIPKWLDELQIPLDIKNRVIKAGLTSLIFKAPTLGLSLHLGFDYMGEHKMGPLSIAMFKVKESAGMALQAALSMARVQTVEGDITNAAMVTTGPSLHGKSTLTIMIELAESKLLEELGIKVDTEEGVYPMNDDIILLQKLKEPKVIDKGKKKTRISYAIDGTENNMYAVPFGLSKDSDPITYDVLRGSDNDPNSQETLENVPFNYKEGTPDFSKNPVRNMRMILSRSRLLARKGVSHLSKLFSNGELEETVHVPMENMDRILWQGVMRQNTVVPPLVRLNPETYVRALMYGEAVQTGASTGAIGRPYVEYFSDPFIIGLEDENANLLYSILKNIREGGLPQEYYMFNTGGIGADKNEEATGPLYKKIDRDLPLLLQEAVLRKAVKFEKEDVLGVDVAVAVVDAEGNEVINLRENWLPKSIYGEEDYKARVQDLKHKRFYGDDQTDKAGILRYTKVNKEIFDLAEIPAPMNEREVAWLVSFYCNLDEAYETIDRLSENLPEEVIDQMGFGKVTGKIKEGFKSGLYLTSEAQIKLQLLGII